MRIGRLFFRKEGRGATYDRIHRSDIGFIGIYVGVSRTGEFKDLSLRCRFLASSSDHIVGRLSLSRSTFICSCVYWYDC